LIAIVGLGIPVGVIMLAYSFLGIEDVLNLTIERPLKNQLAADLNEETRRSHYYKVNSRSTAPTFRMRRFPYTSNVLDKVRNYQPDASTSIGLAHFAAYAYLMSLGWCLSVLFMRAWMTFPLNFSSTE